ncbi:MAG: hypothetical protein CMF29_06735 [Kiritimatiellaceae bacterium]|nr:hypothetical protein [Kiritimatiellaceae bacterium]
MPSESSPDVSRHHLHAFPEPQGLEPPSERSLLLIRRQIPKGAFRDKFMALDDLAQERILRRIWYSPAITNNLDSIRISLKGEIHYVCSELCGHKLPIVADNSEKVIVKSTYDQWVPISSPPVLNSRPESQNIIYLDFNGMIVSNTYWNNDPDYNINSWDTRPYSSDADETTFSPIEQQYIEDIWRGVASDFEAFDVNITTEDPSPNPYFYHALITKSLDKNNQVTPASGVGGIAVLGTPYYSLKNFSPENVRYYSPAWINGQSWFSAEDIALICSHEIGHNLGLNHDGSNSVEYYDGHEGAVSWGPIMGAAYDKNVRAWSIGEYSSANNTQEDDLSIIGYQFSKLTDLEGDLTSPFLIQPDSTGNLAYAGIIQDRNDVDVFQLDIPISGRLQLSVYPTTNNYYGRVYQNWGSSLNIQIRILDSAGATILSNQVVNRLHAEVDMTLSSGSYFIEVDGVSSGDPLSSTPSGFSDYASMGAFHLQGSLPADADSDGMPDSWEIAQIGSTDALPDMDADGDGSNNLNEYVAGTDPLNAGSVFFVADFDITSLSRIISWESSEGSLYRILNSSNLAFDDFSPISSFLPYPINRYTDSVERTDAQLFYKIEVSRP